MKILIDGVVQAVREVRSNAFRAALTILGVALGVAALVAMLGVLESMLTGMQTFNSTRGGLTKISVNDQPVPVEQAHLKYLLRQAARCQDAEALNCNSTLVRNVSPDVDLDWQPVAHGAQMDWARVHGATPAYRALYDLETKSGRFLSELDCEQSAPVCVLGSDIADQIFTPGEPVVGKQVLIGGKHMFTIVGVLTHYMSRQGGRNALWRRNWTVWMPITTAQKQFTGTKKISLLEMQAIDLPNMVPAMDEVESILRPVHRWVRDFKVENDLATMQDFGRQQQRLRASLGSVAALSLLIGGIGIMSVMLAGVNDRIREIGVRKALGAQQSDIFIQFLFEATVLSSVGGFGGVLGGIGLIHFLDRVMVTQPPVLVPAALVIGAVASMVTGLLAGLYPALRAASLDPIEALRAE